MSDLHFLPIADDDSQVTQEWCTQCTPDLDAEPGMGRIVMAERLLPTDLGPQYFLELDCGHRVLCDEPAWPQILLPTDLERIAG